MAEKRIFVGRKDELEKFGKVLEDPKGQAVLVVGQAGMGKTWLINKMAEIAENHPELKCGWVRYEVTQTDSVDSTMSLMMDNAFEAAQVKEGSFDGTPRSLQQWKGLLNIIKIGDLVFSLKHDPAKNTREQFLERLGLISKRMPKNGRAVFIIDPEKYMQKESDQSWAIVVKQLPERIKFVFAQRPEDVLVDSETFNALDNVIRIPPGGLRRFEEKDIKELISRSIGDSRYSVGDISEALSCYRGQPDKVRVMLNLIRSGVPIDRLHDLERYEEGTVGRSTKEFFEYPKRIAKSGGDAVDDAVKRMGNALVELDKSKRNLVIMLFVVLGLGVGGVICALVSRQWSLVATTGTGVIALVFWPVRRLIMIYKEERPLRVIPPLLNLGDEEEGKKVIGELMRKMIDVMK